MAAETGSAREEAERLVAAVLAMAGQNPDLEGTSARLRDGLGSLGDTVSGLIGKLNDPADSSRPAGDSAPRHVRYGWATGSLECCVCPVCRAIAGMRDPNPRSAERLATGAGDVAMGVASVMRGLSTVVGAARPPARAKPAPAPAKRAAAAPDPDTAWSAATRTGRAAETEEPADDSPWAAATRAEARVAAAARAAQKARDEQKAREEQQSEAAPTEKAAPRPSRAPRPGEDVWAAATSPAEDGMAGRTAVDHDDAGDVALGRD